MPQRPSRENNARNSQQRAPQQQPEQHRRHRSSPSLSPPTQLPTPLPEEHLFCQLLLPSTMDYPVVQPQALGGPVAEFETSSSRLIDLDTPPLQLAPLPFEEEILDAEEEDDSLASTYRSPPFREAQLPIEIESPPPLPVPPRIPYPQERLDNVGPNDPVDVGSRGLVRSPTFSRYVLKLSRVFSPFFIVVSFLFYGLRRL